jgi:ABC-type dipeptide/oligopeptide/nickel transport system ATPase component
LDEHPPILEVNGLTVDFNPRKPSQFRALDRLDLSIGKGEIVGLVGESGSGKTALANSILGLLPKTAAITSGTIAWKGREIQNLGEAEWRGIRGKQIAMIAQDPQASLNPVYPVGRQIGWCLKLHRGLEGPEAKHEIIDLLESVRLRDPERCARAYPHELSGGMCQRVMIAMALACRPELLLADESTSALDRIVQNDIVGLLERLHHHHGIAMLVITHDLGMAKRLASRIAVIQDGAVVEAGPPAEVFEYPRLPYTRRLVSAAGFAPCSAVE